MKLRKLIAPRYWAGSLLSLGLLLLLALPTPAPAEDKTRDQQIAEIEKQIAELAKKVNDLKTQPGVQPPAEAPTDWVKALHWRCVGPASMGGRITAISAFEADPTTFWIATASGGLLKTVNNGTTFEHQFDHEATVSIGDVCVAPSNKDVVWVGTGENNPRNSVSYGDGVYKSTDGGKTWQNMGLKKSYQIGKILIHPKDPNIVYVGTLGRLYGPSSEDRGLFKTTDGGKNWQRILIVDDKAGVIDLRMHPAEPETLLVAMWERQRDEFDSHSGEPPMPEGYDGYDPIKKWGPGSGIFKTTDGGKNFKKLTNGLPTSPMGRVGLDFYRKEPNTVFAIIDCQNIGMGTAPGQVYLGVTTENVTGGVRVTEVAKDGPAEKAVLKVGDVIKAMDKKDVANTQALTELIQTKKDGDKLTATVQRDKESLEIAVTLGLRPGQGPRTTGPRAGGGAATGGPTSKRPYSFMYGGQRENVQDQQGPNGFEYGGVYKSTDAGETWTRVNSLNPRPMYFSLIRVDPTDDKNLYVGGISMSRSIDGGKTFKDDGGKGVHPDQHALWIDPKDGRHMIVGCDGGFYATYDRMENWDFLNHAAIGQFYHVAVDNKKPYNIYGGLQDNGTWGGPSHTFTGSGPMNEDWISVSGGDGFVCRVDANDPDLIYYETQDGNMARRNLRTGEFGFNRPRDVEGQPAYRFNWNTPFILSNHNSRIFYGAGNHVFRSFKQGTNPQSISPEISRTKRGTATALCESPRNADVLWAGTDDGFLWVTRDGGVKWTNVTAKVGLPGFRCVASIEASKTADGRAYVTFDGHRSNDDEPYVYVTEDFGDTWKSLRANLPTGSTRVLREDIENPNLLYLGTEFAAWASLNRGQSWVKINSNLPTVAVHEYAQPVGAGEIVAATHGRSVWILDVSALRQLTPETFKEDAHLFQPATAVRWRTEPPRGSTYGIGARKYFGENPPPGAAIYYSLAKKPQKVSLKVMDYTGATVRDIDIKSEVGLNKVSWDMLRTAPVRPPVAGEPPPRRRPQFLSDSFLMAAGPSLLVVPLGRRPGGPNMAYVPPGMYRVVLTVDGKEYAQGIRIEGDPTQQPLNLFNDEDN